MARKRKADWARLARRQEWQQWRLWNVYRQRGRCFYCREAFSERWPHLLPTLDHYMPTAKGGPDSFENTVAACAGCNGRKKDTPGDAFIAIMRLEKMPASTIVIGTAFTALVAARLAHVWKSERSNALASSAAAQLLRIGQAPTIPEPIDPDQDCTGDMPEKSSVRRDIEATQARSNEFGGAQRLRYPGRWKARFTEARPEAPKRDWL